MNFNVCGECKLHDGTLCMCRLDGKLKVGADTACTEFIPLTTATISNNTETKRIDRFFGTPVGKK